MRFGRPQKFCASDWALRLKSLHALQHFVERLIQFLVLAHSAAQHRLEVPEIGNIDDLIHAVNEGAHCIVSRQTMAEQHHEVLPPLGIGLANHFRKKWIGLQRRAFKVLVNDNHVVVVSPKFQQNVLDEESEVDFVSHVDQLGYDDLLVLLVIDTDQGRVVTEIEKTWFGFLFHYLLAKRVFGNVEAQTGIEVVVYATHFLD